MKKRLPSGLTESEQENLTSIFNRKIDYVDHPDFHKPNAYAKLFARDVDLSEAEQTWNVILSSVFGACKIDPLTKEDKYLLTADEEKTLFLQLNYARMQERRLQGKTIFDLVAARTLIHWDQRVHALLGKVTVANLGLVMSQLRNNGWGHYSNASELFSMGCVGLVRAAESFDVQKGFRFSTYAFRGIYQKMLFEMRRFSRREKEVSCQAMEGELLIDDNASEIQARELAESIDDLKYVLHHKAGLTEREQKILAYRFGYAKGCKGEPLRFRDIGKKLGLSGQGVLNNFNKALDKLRKAYVYRGEEISV